jgi:transglutaminase-like putative cysteine protease
MTELFYTAPRDPLALQMGGAQDRALSFEFPMTNNVLSIIGVIRRVADAGARSPEVRRAAFEIVGKEYPLATWRLGQFVRTRVRYVPDPVQGPGADPVELVISPVRMLQDIQRFGETAGDCDDHVALLVALAQSLGIEARILAVKVNGSAEYNHVIASLWNGRGWVDIDTCVKDGETPSYPERIIV